MKVKTTQRSSTNRMLNGQNQIPTKGIHVLKISQFHLFYKQCFVYFGQDYQASSASNKLFSYSIQHWKYSEIKE